MRDLPLLDAAIRETLRLHPPIHSIMRYVRDDVPVPPTYAAPSKDGSFIVPQGHYVLASPLVSQMDPKVWKEPTKWDPYRWSDPEGVASQALKTYVDGDGEKIDFGFGAVSKGTESPYQPFGAGRHRCIGEQVSQIPFLFMFSISRDDLCSSHTYNLVLFSPRSLERWKFAFQPASPSIIIMYVFLPLTFSSLAECISPRL